MSQDDPGNPCGEPLPVRGRILGVGDGAVMERAPVGLEEVGGRDLLLGTRIVDGDDAFRFERREERGQESAVTKENREDRSRSPLLNRAQETPFVGDNGHDVHRRAGSRSASEILRGESTVAISRLEQAWCETIRRVANFVGYEFQRFLGSTSIDEVEHPGSLAAECSADLAEAGGWSCIQLRREQPRQLRRNDGWADLREVDPVDHPSTIGRQDREAEGR